MRFRQSLPVFALLLLLVSGAQANPLTQDRGKQYEIKFSGALPAPELARMVETYRLEARELKCEIPVGGDTMYAGYTVAGSKTIKEAISGMSARHVSFLEAALATTGERLTTETDPVLVEGLRQWNERFALLLKDARKENLSFIAMTVDGGPLLEALTLNPRVRSVTPVGAGRGEVEAAQTLKRPFILNASYLPKPSWAPFKGSSKVTQRMSFQTFYFDDVSAFDSLATYEHEAQVYEKKFAYYDGYYATNMPDHYRDTTFLDSVTNRDCGCEIFGVGTTRASGLQAKKMYWSDMSLRPGTKKNARVIIKGQLGRLDAVRRGWRSQWNVRGVATTTLYNLTAPAPNQLSWTNR